VFLMGHLSKESLYEFQVAMGLAFQQREAQLDEHMQNMRAAEARLIRLLKGALS
jgi:hypothetical protein